MKSLAVARFVDRVMFYVDVVVIAIVAAGGLIAGAWDRLVGRADAR